MEGSKKKRMTQAYHSKKINRKSFIDIFEKIILSNEKEKKPEVNSINMKKITLRKAETMYKHTFFKRSSSFFNKEDISATVDHINENYYETNPNGGLICFICDSIIPKEKIYRFSTCLHIFCDKCGKGFYEDKIEQGEKYLKCPSFKCPSLLNDNILETLVSNLHLNHFKKNAPIENTNNIVNNNANSHKLNSKFPFKSLVKKNTIFIKQDYFKMYSQKHVLDISTQDTFFGFNRAKDQFCNKCYEPSLFGKTGRNYIKCLNCSHFTCKYCMKDFGSDHFDLSSINYCKIFFRKKISKNVESPGIKCLKIVINSIAVYVFSYIFFIVGTVFIINGYLLVLLESILKRSHIFGMCLYLFTWMIIGLILLLFFWMIIPFFPVLIAIFQ